FVYPACGNVTSPFGYRRGRMHYGCDIDLETGDEVQAAFEGMVRISQFHDSYGNVVVVRHNNGLESLYAHLSRRYVSPGDYLEAGDLIGLGGNTGRSYGAHLHFELRYLGHPIDPSFILNHTEKSLKSNHFRLFKNMFGKSVAADESHGNNGSNKGSSARYYIIRRGDTLSAIARKNHTTVSRLCRLNSLRESSRLKIGQRIKLR
ncbi:MAG: peptidoglycan DD-metalloendopeptidase family protein, partial [Flavobacteriales bacterium]